MTGLDLSGRSVLITGASRGIGHGIAQGFAAAGARLHVCAETDAIAEAADAIGATPHLCDVSDDAAVRAMIAAVGHLDVLVNNAGLELITPLDDESPETEAAVRRILEINVVGTFLVTRAAVPAMSPGAAIVNTASVWGRVAEPCFGAYVASKHAVIGLTKTFARELGPKGIRVNAVCPGWVRTEASMRSLGRMAERAGTEPDALLAGIVGAQALPGLMEPRDMIGAYLFLASDLAANITGQSLGADRGEVPW
ncbi:SDR family NAD(P)-dependent oxidoreductase [Jiella sonneratiae]|uniref:SDR family oxidoreductase n=1 Tax=Jiella sonneratiae TaxID=2816856 RepID=A0ABS3J8P4_9HYPH|nr:SDR family oxidoreductase [Jiella sonneratiae]MBO0906039.1 SDR family oxidoreductase [Jiella sonneratiae]